MPTIDQQVHAKFKMFAGKLEGHGIGGLAREVEAFAASAGAAAKSIGVEYLEHAKTVVVTLGYRDDEPYYPISLHTISLGTGDARNPADLARLEARMGEEAARVPNIICHELFVTESDEFVVVFMRHAAT
jgi:hypothetical protein